MEIDQTLSITFVQVKEFQAGVYMQDQTCWTVPVHHHKTANSAGGAEMPIVGGGLKRLIELYIEDAMPLSKAPILPPDSDKVLIPLVEPTNLKLKNKWSASSWPFSLSSTSS